jgi:hypothetical protein
MTLVGQDLTLRVGNNGLLEHVAASTAAGLPIANYQNSNEYGIVSVYIVTL